MTIVRSNPQSPVTKIYESPDGGKTIYVREAGSALKTLLTRDPKHLEHEKKVARADRLLTILNLSETDNTLKDALEALEALYIIKYSEHDKDN